MATGVFGLSFVLINDHSHPIRSSLRRRLAASSCHLLLDAHLWLDFLSFDALDNLSGQECTSQCGLDESMCFLGHCLHLIQPSVCHVSLSKDLHSHYKQFAYRSSWIRNSKSYCLPRPGQPSVLRITSVSRMFHWTTRPDLYDFISGTRVLL
jgi:hypothetical protein